MTLYELENGDVFAHAKDKAKQPKRFIVYGNPMRNRHGRTRFCKLPTGQLTSKSCDLEVVKIGNSVYKSKIQEMFNPKALMLQ